MPPWPSTCAAGLRSQPDRRPHCVRNPPQTPNLTPQSRKSAAPTPTPQPLHLPSQPNVNNATVPLRGRCPAGQRGVRQRATFTPASQPIERTDAILGSPLDPEADGSFQDVAVAEVGERGVDRAFAIE